MIVGSTSVVGAAAASPAPATGIEAVRPAELVQRIPARPADAKTGTEFVASIRRMDAQQRERATHDQILRGNVPTFLRRLVPVQMALTLQNGRTLHATLFVMPDYLAIGSDDDYVRMPMNLETATDLATQFGFVLPTRKIVNAIYEQSDHHFVPEPLTPGPQMTSTDYYVHHNDLIERQAQAGSVRPGELVSGHKKDVVLTNLLARTPGRIAIYGWHRATGSPIQPLSTVHGACYEDYSHGIRFVSETALVDGTIRRVEELLQDAATAPLLSDEGPIRAVFGGDQHPTMQLVTFAPGYCSAEKTTH